MLRTQGVLFQSGKYGGFVEAVAQLPRRDGLCTVRGEIGKPPSALLDGYAVLQELPRKILDGERFVQRFSDDLTQLFLVGFKACRLGGLARLSALYMPADILLGSCAAVEHIP